MQLDGNGVYLAELLMWLSVVTGHVISRRHMSLSIAHRHRMLSQHVCEVSSRADVCMCRCSSSVFCERLTKETYILAHWRFNKPAAYTRAGRHFVLWPQRTEHITVKKLKVVALNSVSSLNDAGKSLLNAYSNLRSKQNKL